MELKILEETKTKLVIDMTGEDHTLCNMLKKELWKNKHVKVAGYNIDHPYLFSKQLRSVATTLAVLVQARNEPRIVRDDVNCRKLAGRWRRLLNKYRFF
ncbi:DNA-directed RNA polymerase subunit L [Candidatus Woesearchaeota archaeon]|nr:DNA-directed RNA polymerase subunit L [Candidatus Woesearchaeota archaeon]